MPYESALDQPHRSLISNLFCRRSLLFDLGLATLLIVAGIWLRLAFLHLPNFAPVAGFGLFAGFLLTRKSVALLVPAAIVVISDFWIGTYHPGIMLSVLGCFLVTPLLGAWLKRAYQRTGVASAFVARLKTLACVLGGSILFFIVTNLAVWCCSTHLGFWECYVNAIPFYRFTLYGDLCFSFALFGSYELVHLTTKLSRTSELVASDCQQPVALPSQL
jgi:hypothetical protein